MVLMRALRFVFMAFEIAWAKLFMSARDTDMASGGEKGKGREFKFDLPTS